MKKMKTPKKQRWLSMIAKALFKNKNKVKK